MPATGRLGDDHLVDDPTVVPATMPEACAHEQAESPGQCGHHEGRARARPEAAEDVTAQVVRSPTRGRKEPSSTQKGGMNRVRRF